MYSFVSKYVRGRKRRNDGEQVASSRQEVGKVVKDGLGIFGGC